MDKDVDAHHVKNKRLKILTLLPEYQIDKDGNIELEDSPNCNR